MRPPPSFLSKQMFCRPHAPDVGNPQDRAGHMCTEILALGARGPACSYRAMTCRSMFALREDSSQVPDQRRGS